MDNSPLITERVLNAPVEKVWSAITNRDEMEKWYFKIAAFLAEPDFTFQFTGEGRKGDILSIIVK